MELKNFFAQDTQGNVIPIPTAYLYQPGTTTLISGLQDNNGAPLANPFTGNIQGQLQFAAPDGDYDLRIVGAGRDFTMRVRFIDVVDLQGQIDAKVDTTTLAENAGAALVGHNDGADGTLWTTIAGFIAFIRSALGAAIIGFQAAGVGAAVRTLWAKLMDLPVSVKDFGAVGDGVANDTTAFTAAIAYIESTGNPVFVPTGIYSADPLQIDAQAFALQGFFYGNEPASTIIRRRTAGAGAFITIGNASATVFQAQILGRGIMIDGGPSTNGPACLMYDVVRSRFENMIFSGGSIAMNSKGGITNTFDGCTFQLAGQGFRFENHSSLVGGAGGGFPNANRMVNCQIVDNIVWGGVFDGGMLLRLSGCQIEGNGTTLGANQGGLLVGSNIGIEIAVNDTTAMGVDVDGCWFESNKGIADIYLQSGINSVSNSNFYSVGTGITNDIRIDGGRYRLRNLNMGHAKTTGVLEGSGVLVGNVIEYVDVATLSYNSQKTAFNQGWRAFLGNGAVPGVNGATSPLIQVGTDATTANPTVTFNQPFKSGTVPRVYVSQVNNSTGTIEAVDVYGVSNSGFTMRKKSFNGGTIGTVNYSVNWLAVGENP